MCHWDTHWGYYNIRHVGGWGGEGILVSCDVSDFKCHPESTQQLFILMARYVENGFVVRNSLLPDTFFFNHKP